MISLRDSKHELNTLGKWTAFDICIAMYVCLAQRIQFPQSKCKKNRTKNDQGEINRNKFAW